MISVKAVLFVVQVKHGSSCWWESYWTLSTRWSTSWRSWEPYWQVSSSRSWLLVMQRKSVSEPLQTGLKAIDALVPIGRSTSWLSGDLVRMRENKSIAIGCYFEPKRSRYDLYLCSDLPKETTVRTRWRLVSTVPGLHHRCDSFYFTTFHCLQLLLCWAAMAEEYVIKGSACFDRLWWSSKNKRSLIVNFLLLRRPPGREAFPGMFSTSTAVCLKLAKFLMNLRWFTAYHLSRHKQGDISAYIATNVISITDGQIFLGDGLFNAGIRPAIDGFICIPCRFCTNQSHEKVAGTLYRPASYRELEALYLFGSDLDAATQAKLEPKYWNNLFIKPLPVEKQVTISALTHGFDTIPVDALFVLRKSFMWFLWCNIQRFWKPFVETEDLSQKK